MNTVKQATNQQLRFDGQVAIITGAGGGMGEAHAKLLAERGAKVVINDLFAESADKVVKAISDAGHVAIAVAGSIADPAVAEKITQAAIDNFGRIDILINNAGIEIKKSFDDFTLDEFQKVIDVHVKGSWVLTSCCWPHMKKQQYGRVIMVCSNSIYGMMQNSAYVTAKGALYGLTKSLAIEGEEFGIQTNALAPIALTAMARQMIGENPEHLDWMASTVPIWTVSPVLAWLVHRDNKVNGEMISAYGRNAGRIFVSETLGSCVPEGEWSPEVVRDHFQETMNEAGAVRAESVSQAMNALFASRTTKGAQSRIISV